jgi:hypothetical protein
MTSKPQATVSRRKLLSGLAVSAVGLGAVAASALNRTWFSRDARGSGSWWDRQFTALDHAGMNEWRRQIGSEFRVGAETGATSLKLVEVRPLASSGARPAGVSRDRAFLAVFDGGAAGQRPAGDRLYDVAHSRGDMRIYFSAADPAATTARLAAVFN